jgi:hypothetical protein
MSHLLYEELNMRSTIQLGLQHDLHHDLQSRYREFFESKLAVLLLDKTELFAAVRKISTAILNFMNDNKQKIVKQLFMEPKILHELYDTRYFGHLSHDTDTVPLPEKIASDMQMVLQDEQAPLSQVMQIHSIFVYRLYDHVQEKNRREEVAKQYFPEAQHSSGHSDRVEREDKVSLTKQFGISRHPVFKKLIGEDKVVHARAVDRFVPNMASSYCQEMSSCHIPFAAGRSGHTRTLLTGALLYGDFSGEEFKEYALAIFVFLAAGGNHSFYEVMQVAKLVGVPCDKENYRVSLPSSFQASESYKMLSRIFPEYLDEAISIEQSPSPVIARGF